MIYLIAAVADNDVIGKDNDLVWRIKEDMLFFKETTTGQILLMGRKNFESIPEKFRPLPNRLNCILTRNQTYVAADCVTVDSIESWIDLYKNDDRELFIIGGGQVYKEALEKNLVDAMYITHVHAHPDGDTFFPTINKNEWKSEILQKGIQNESNEFAYTIKKYTRK
jgi:dihydrofolate reductase